MQDMVESAGSRSETSRKNGAKSKGPATITGKTRSSSNSLKYGIFAKAAVIEGELQAELDDLLQDLMRDFNPQSRIESLLVENIALGFWRLKLDRLHLPEVALVMFTSGDQWARCGEME